MADLCNHDGIDLKPAEPCLSNGAPDVAARSGNETAEEANWRALRTAWQPIAAGFKAIWWKALALPDDVFDEDEFRASKAVQIPGKCVYASV